MLCVLGFAFHLDGGFPYANGAGALRKIGAGVGNAYLSVDIGSRYGVIGRK